MGEMTYSEGLQKCMDIANDLLNFPLHGMRRSDIFSTDGIKLFKDLSDQMQFNRRKRSWGVFGGSLTSIVGGGMAIAGAALIPVTFGASIALLVAGGGVTAAGAAVSVGFSLDKYFADKDRAKLARPLLEKFIQFQKDLASAIVTIHTCYLIIDDQMKCKIALECGLNLDLQQKLSALQNQLKDLRDRSERMHTHEIIHELSNVGTDLTTNVLVSMLQPVKESLRVEKLWCEEKITHAKQNPFDFLIVAIEQLDKQHQNEEGTFFDFVKKLFKSAGPENVDHNLMLPAGVCLEKTGNVLIKAGMIATRTALRAVDVGQDTARIAANVLRAAKAASIAGIVLNVVGIVVDVAFLGLAAYDLKKKDKEEYPKALQDIAAVMQELNDLCW